MQTFISPIGFNTTSVTRSLLDHGIDSGDTIQLVRPATETDDDRAAEAVEDVEQLLQEIEPTISVSVETVSHNDFENAVMTCSDLIRTADGQVVVSLSGGARDVLLPLTVATMAHEATVTTTLGYSDIDGQVRELGIPSVTTTLADGARMTLQAVADANSKATLPELASGTEAVKSTITRHVTALEDAGYVSSWMEDRIKHVSITLSGRLYLATLGQGQDKT
jgi:CRISPR-associated protein Csa3